MDCLCRENSALGFAQRTNLSVILIFGSTRRVLIIEPSPARWGCGVCHIEDDHREDFGRSLIKNLLRTKKMSIMSVLNESSSEEEKSLRCQTGSRSSPMFYSVRRGERG